MATHVEEVKNERILPDVEALAKLKYEEIPADEFERLKWVGFYRQKQAPYFMVRIKVSGGRMSPTQLTAISRMACSFGNGINHITTRQDIELHELQIRCAPELFRQLAEIGLTTKGACGDTVRNIVGVPCAGACPHEVLNVEPLRQFLYDHFLNDPAVLNLPRKFKFSLSGCPVHPGQYGINDVGLFPSRNAARVAAEGPGFELWVAGGLGAQPMLAQQISDYIPVAEVPAACAATVETHRLYGNRNTRTQARLKHVVKKWGIEKYREAWTKHFAESLAKIGRVQLDLSVKPGAPWTPTVDAPFYPLRERDRYGVECMVPLGDARAEDCLSLADFCRANNASVRLTVGQNLHVLNLTPAACAELRQRVKQYGWALQNTATPNVVACVGLYECGKALWYTKTVAGQITGLIHKDGMRDLPRGLTINFSGCPNNCGQHGLAAIGFMGAVKTEGWRKSGVYSLYLGGLMNGEGMLSRMVANGVKPESVPDLIRALAAAFRTDRAIAAGSADDTGDAFSLWARALTKERLAAILQQSGTGAVALSGSAPIAEE